MKHCKCFSTVRYVARRLIFRSTGQRVASRFAANQVSQEPTPPALNWSHPPALALTRRSDGTPDQGRFGARSLMVQPR